MKIIKRQPTYYEKLNKKEKFMIFFKYFGVLSINLFLIFISVYNKLWFLVGLFCFTGFVLAKPTIVVGWLKKILNKLM